MERERKTRNRKRKYRGKKRKMIKKEERDKNPFSLSLSFILSTRSTYILSDIFYIIITSTGPSITVLIYIFTESTTFAKF